MDKIKKIIAENSRTIGTALEFVLLVIALFVGLKSSVNKAFQFKDKAKLKEKKMKDKTEIKKQKLQNKADLKAFKASLR